MTSKAIRPRRDERAARAGVRRKRFHLFLTIFCGLAVFCATPCVHADGCVEDLDDDGLVALSDLLVLLDLWGPCPGCTPDFDENGDVGFADLIRLLAAWGSCPTVECHYCDCAGNRSVQVSDKPSECRRLGGTPRLAGDPEPPCYPRECDEDSARCGDDRCHGHGATGNPVHLFSGEKVETFIDLHIPGRGFDFVLRRTYRSRAEVQTIQGYNWGMSYDIRFERDGKKLVLHTGDLRRDEFFPRADGSYHRAEFFDRIEISDEPGGSISMRKSDGSVWSFARLDDPEHPGRIISRRDRHDNEMRFEYDAQGRLATVLDTLDTPRNPRAITFAYNADGFLASVTDWTGREIVYEYYEDGDADGSAGDLKSARSPVVVGTPTGNDFPDGKTSVYTYTTGFGDERLNHNLASCTDPKGQTFKVLTYGVAGDELDRVTRQVLGGDIIDYTYVPQVPSEDNSFATMLTITNDRMGNVEHRFFDDSNRLLILREFTGRADPALPTTLSENLPESPLRPVHDPPFFETRYAWDTNSSNGFSLEPNGDSVVNTFDVASEDPRPRGNLLERVQQRRSDDPIRTPIVEQFEYLDDFGGGCCGGGSEFITLHVDGRGHDTVHDYDPDTGDRVHTRHRVVTMGVLGGGEQVIEEFWQYNGFGQVTQYTNPTERTDVFTYYDSGHMNGYLESMIIDSGGFALTTTYGYDPVGNVTDATDPRGHDTQYIRNELNQVVRELAREVEIDPLTVRYERDTFYDANDNVVRVDIQNVDEAGEVVAENTHFTTVYEYDILNYVTRMCEEAGTFTADVPGPPELPGCEGLPESEFITTEYAYDMNRNRTLVRFGEAVEGRDPFNVVRTLYDERNLTFQIIRGEGGPDESIMQYDYDSNGNLVRHTMGVGSAEPRIAVSTYDSYDRLITTTDPEGNVVTYAYDDNHNRVLERVEGERIDGESGEQVVLVEMTSIYDEMDRLIESDAAHFDEEGTDVLDGSSTAKTFYDEASYVIGSENDNGHVTVTAYDSANRREVVTDAKGNTSTYTYDANSNVVSIADVELSDLPGAPPEQFTTTYEYDALDRLVAMTDNVGNTNRYFYDSRDNPTLLADALDHQTRSVYDGINRLLRTILDMDDDGADAATVPGDGDPDIVVARSWDDTSRLVRQTDDSGNTTGYAYDGLDRLIVTRMADGTLRQVGEGAVWIEREQLPDLSGFVSGYDVHDNRTLMSDANGSVATCTYDLNNRLTLKSIVPGPGVSGDTTLESYRYDGLSRVVRAEDDDSAVTRGYDSLSSVTVETLAIGATPPEETRSLHDGVGNKLECIYPDMSRVITHTYDDLERKSIILDGGLQLATYEYVGPGRVARRTQSDGNIVTAYAYDGITGIPNPPGDFGVRQIIGTTHTAGGGGPVLDDRTYKWDRMYNKVQRADVREGGPELTHDYTYDPIYRLVRTQVTDGDGAPVRDTDYRLDGVGNREYVGGDGAYGWDATEGGAEDCAVNQYTFTPEGHRAYDENGNLTVIGSCDPPEGVERLNHEFDGPCLLAPPVLDPDNTASFAGHFADGAYVMTDLVPIVPAGEQPEVRMKRTVVTPDDYVMQLEISWDEDELAQTFNTRLELRNADGTIIARVGVVDLEDAEGPRARSQIMGVPQDGFDLPLAGSAVCTLMLERVAESTWDVTALVNGIVVQEGQADREVDDLRVWTRKRASLPFANAVALDRLLFQPEGEPVPPAEELGEDRVHISYDYRNQMVAYEDLKKGAVHTYAYDALGRRIERVVDSTGAAEATRYYYDGWQVCEERDGFGATAATYVYGLYIDEVLNMQRDTDGLGGPEDYYFLGDDLFSVVAVVNARGELVERYEYGDYGATLEPGTLARIAGDPSAVGNPYLFTGRRYEPAIEWYYYRTRFLDPGSGRFTTRDGLGSWGDPLNLGNAFTYVSNSPQVLVDPFGYEKMLCFWRVLPEGSKLLDLLARDAEAKKILDRKLPLPPPIELPELPWPLRQWSGQKFDPFKPLRGRTVKDVAKEILDQVQTNVIIHATIDRDEKCCKILSIDGVTVEGLSKLVVAGIGGQIGADDPKAKLKKPDPKDDQVEVTVPLTVNLKIDPEVFGFKLPIEAEVSKSHNQIYDCSKCKKKRKGFQ